MSLLFTQRIVLPILKVKMTLVFALFVLLGIAPAVVFGQLRLSQCTFTVGNQQTNAQAFYHCANDFVSYDALNLPFTSRTACV